MATGQMSDVLQHLRRTMLLREEAGLTDGQLLKVYISRREEAALATLVRRHGPMVWGVCRRVLRNYHDTEDAFQATFLVLVRKAASIASPDLLANWLYGVAHQTALKARTMTGKRRARERQVTEMPEPAVTEQDRWNDLQPLLDQELSLLPDKYRVAIVLCDLEGKTRKEVARQLGVPEGTLAARVARGREMLAKRLTQRGVTLSGGALAAVLSQNVASAGVPALVVSNTIRAATLLAAGQAAATGAIPVKVAALMEGMMKAMLFTKLRAAVAVVLMVGFVATGATILTWRTAAGQDDKKSIAEKPVEPAAKQEKEKGVPATIGGQAGLPAQATNEAEKLFRQMEGELSKARTLECVFEGKVQPKGSLKGSLTFAEGNKVRVEYSLDIEGDRQVTATVVSDGAKVVKVLNGKEPEPVFEASTEDVPLKPQSHREMMLRSFALGGGNTVLELCAFELKVSAFKLGKKEKLDGRDAQSIEYEVTVEGAGSISTAVWLDAKTTLPIKRVTSIDKGAGEKYTVTETYTNLTLNKNIDAKKFELPR